MTSAAMNAMDTLLTRVDWLTDRGSTVIRAVAIFSWLGAAAATATAFSTLGAAGWLFGLICLLPGWLLWRYAARLSGALDSGRIRDQLSGAATRAKTRLSDVASSVQDVRRRPIRGGLGVIRTVRAVRSDLAELGVDVTGIAAVASPGSLLVAAGSIVCANLLWLIAVAGLVFRWIF